MILFTLTQNQKKRSLTSFVPFSMAWQSFLQIVQKIFGKLLETIHPHINILNVFKHRKSFKIFNAKTFEKSFITFQEIKVGLLNCIS